jgi:4-hydroxythreonine-4-phosphate dehydrogenase
VTPGAGAASGLPSLPRGPLAVTLGDPAGIGPEIVAKAWLELREDGPPFVVVGDRDLVAAALGRGRAPVQRVGAPREAAAMFRDALPVLDLPLTAPVVAGKPSPAYAPAVVRWIETGAGLALSGAVRGLVTAPIAKGPLYEAGFRFPGHTEFLADLTKGAPFAGPRGPVMMLTAADLRAVLVTIHLPLRDVFGALSTAAIVHVGQVTAHALQHDFGLARPRLALAALNPHAGEGGALGREEIEVIAPAIAQLRDEGVDASGPFAADTMFHPRARATYDVALCPYHDQALVPIKTLHFDEGVNMTLGLPIVRTSPDHGTAFAIAGQDRAEPGAMIAAIVMAGEAARRRAEFAAANG